MYVYTVIYKSVTLVRRLAATMGLLSITFLLSVLVPAYLFRESGIFGIDLWGHVLQHDPETCASIFTRNYAIYLSLYVPVYLVLYHSPMSLLFQPFKLNKRYPPVSLVTVEAARSLRGVLIASLMEIVVHELTRRGACPVCSLPFFHVDQDRGAASALPLLGALITGYLWGDCHFYFTHRLLHFRQLYAKIHKYHHESFNPDPFSGLSMHPIESAVYFFSAFAISFFVPLWFARLMFIGQIVFPLEGHAGFGSWNHEETVNHYIHHSKFEWNYGSSPLWDKICGTDYKLGATNNSVARENAAAESARLAGSIIGKGFDGEAAKLGKRE